MICSQSTMLYGIASGRLNSLTNTKTHTVNVIRITSMNYLITWHKLTYVILWLQVLKIKILWKYEFLFDVEYGYDYINNCSCNQSACSTASCVVGTIFIK